LSGEQNRRANQNENQPYARSQEEQTGLAIFAKKF
jgi:hypothetical protein